jgi:type II secretion system protein G
MLNRIREAKKNEHGFTLIELLIVIVILGILAAIVVFSVAGITDRGKASACKADYKTVEVASEAYYAKNGAYATAITVAAPATPPTDLVHAGFLHEAPSSPDYTITYTAATGAVAATGACTLP